MRGEYEVVWFFGSDNRMEYLYLASFLYGLVWFAWIDG